jgi:hypothetical protein
VAPGAVILLGIVRFERIFQLIEETGQVTVTLAQQLRRLREHDLRPRGDVTGRAAVRLALSRGIVTKRTHVIERGLYCFSKLGALHILRRGGIVRLSPVFLDERR